MCRIAICEDEPSMARENETMICHILESCHFRRDIDFSVASFSEPEPLLAVLRKQLSAFHLLLLDIGLAQENGVELANRLREWNVDCSIIYITAYSEYALNSFASHLLEYLIKPVDEKRLKKAIQWDLQKITRGKCPSREDSRTAADGKHRQRGRHPESVQGNDCGVHGERAGGGVGRGTGVQQVRL